MNEFENPMEQEPKKSFSARILGRLGFVYGDGLSEFGMKKVGWGLPLYRRRELEAHQAAARNTISAAMDIETYRIPAESDPEQNQN